MKEQPGESVSEDAPFVVVADDDDDIRAALSEALRADGFQVTAVPDGRYLADLLASCRLRSRLPGRKGRLLLDFAW